MTGLESSIGWKLDRSAPRSGGTINQLGQPVGTSFERKSDDAYSRQEEKGNKGVVTTTPTNNADISQTDRSVAERKYSPIELGGGSGPSFGGRLLLWLTPRFGLAGSYDFSLNKARVELSDGQKAGLGIPARGSHDATESWLATTVVSSPSSASATATPSVGPSGQAILWTASDIQRTTEWAWSAAGMFGAAAPSFTFRTDNAIPLPVFTERQKPFQVATPSVAAGDTITTVPIPGNNRTGKTTDEVPHDLSPGPIIQIARRLTITRSAGGSVFGRLGYSPSTSTTTWALRPMRSFSGGSVSSTEFRYINSDNESGVAGGDVAVPPGGGTGHLGKLADSHLFRSGGDINLLSTGQIRLQPSEASATDSVAALLDPRVTYTGSGEVRASTSTETTFSLFSLLGKVTAWSDARTELWVGMGLAAPWIWNRTTTVVALTGEGGVGEARQVVEFIQNEPGSNKATSNNDQDRVTSFKEITDISATESVVAEGNGTLWGPMLGVGGRGAITNNLVIYGDLSWAPVVAGRLVMTSRTKSESHQRTALETTLKTYVGGDVPTVQGAVTDTQTLERSADDSSGPADSGATRMVPVSGQALEARLGIRWWILPFLALGVEGRDQLVTATWESVNVGNLNQLGGSLSLNLAF